MPLATASMDQDIGPENPYWFSDIEAPIIIDDADASYWQDEADVLVVGFGGAGASAAIEAVDQGASVIVLERFQGGGATTQSGGIVYAGGGTQYQSDAGFADSPQQMYNYLQQETQGVVSDATLKRFCDDSAAMIDWLESHGVEFDASMSPVKTSYPNKHDFLYYSGNETVAEYAAKAAPAPRGHRPYGRGLSGAELYEPLKRAALDKGVRVQVQSRVTRLVKNKLGVVVGVEIARIDDQSSARQHKALSQLATQFWQIAPLVAWCKRRMSGLETRIKVERIRAKKGVILAAGGFVANRAMVERYAPKYSAGMPLAALGCDGSGIRLGQSVGAMTRMMSKISAWRFINPPLQWAKGIIVNAEGRRYCSEQIYGAKLGHHMVEENNGKAILVLSHDLFLQALKSAMPWKIPFFQSMPALLNMLLNARRAKTVEELAARYDIPEQNLRATVDQYNRVAAGEATDEFGKSEEFISGLYSGPYYGMDVSIDSRLFPCPTITFGGLAVEEESGRVLDQNEQVIGGLYAAGRTAVGIASNFYVSGLSIADCVFSGRRAGRDAALAD